MKNINKTTIITSIVILFAIIGGIVVIKKAKAKSDNAPVASVFPISVSTVKIASDGNQLTLPYLAIVQNDQDVTISSKISARIQYLKPSGSTVKAGEVVAKLDNSSFQTNLQSIQSQLSAQKIAVLSYQLDQMSMEDYLKYEDDLVLAKATLYKTQSQKWQTLMKLAVIYSINIKTLVQ